jgi:hypothetical protein
MTCATYIIIIYHCVDGHTFFITDTAIGSKSISVRLMTTLSESVASSGCCDFCMRLNLPLFFDKPLLMSVVLELPCCCQLNPSHGTVNIHQTLSFRQISC